MNPEKLTLPNGLRLILVPQPGSFTATVLILVEAGSEYETKKINGLSHFLEHLMFKGTKKRPEPGQIARELDALGADYNAFTSNEDTGYWAKAEAHKLPKLLDLVSDMFLNPIFNSAEIEKERGVIIEELNMDEDNPMRHIHDIFSALMFGDQPAGWDVGGTKENIKRLTREQFVDYRAKHYIAPATCVIVAGKFNRSQVIKFILQEFGDLSKRPKMKKARTKLGQPAPRLVLKHKKSEQTHLLLGFPAYDLFHPKRYALQVLMNILGGGMSSRLWIKVREELGAAYYIHGMANLLLDHGAVAVGSGVDHTKLEQVLNVILEELGRVKREPVGEAELKKAKDHLVGQIILGLETSDELAGYYGGQEILTHRLTSPEELIRRIQSVRASEIQAVARELFIRKNLNLAMIGPHKRAETFKRLLRSFK